MIHLAVLGPQEIGFIFLALLLLFGAKKLPELARGMGKSMGEFKKARSEFEDEILNAETEETRPKEQKANLIKEAPGKETRVATQCDDDHCDHDHGSDDSHEA